MSTASDDEGFSISADHRDVQSTHVDSMGWNIGGSSVTGMYEGCFKIAYLLHQGTQSQVVSLPSAFFRLSTGTAKYIQEWICRGWDQSFRIQAIGAVPL